jgi:nucleoside 2-deoxyribosyltransferase
MNSKKTVFLSGPIRGLSRKDSLEWRNLAVKSLSKKFNVLHALRGREEKEVFTDPRAAVIRDLNDIHYCDILLVNDCFSDASMIGTAMEVFYAHQNNKPVIIFGNGHDKDYWLNYHSHLRVKDLKEACQIINDMFS